VILFGVDSNKTLPIAVAIDVLFVFHSLLKVNFQCSKKQKIPPSFT